MKGSYVLIIKLERREKLKIGALGEIEFEKGYYAYVGSAMNSIEKRVERHSKRDKILKWHIDYLLRQAKIKNIFCQENNEKEECKIAEKFLLDGFSYIKNFFHRNLSVIIF